MARGAPGAARSAREQLIEAGWDALILGTLVELVDDRRSSSGQLSSS